MTTALGQIWAQRGALDPSLSGLRLLPDGVDALAVRVALTNEAERTLDIQYYMIHADATGLLLIERAIAAADRGVRVRVLVDDIYAAKNDRAIAAIDLHPHIEVRLFNPWKWRGNAFGRALNFMLSPGRLNHRMHNKLYVADNVAVVLGGRNLGDEYFAVHDEFDFRDLDVLGFGPVAAQASASFDEYWNSRWAIPAAALRNVAPTDNDFADLRERLRENRLALTKTPYARALRASDLATDLRRGVVDLELAPARVVADAADKIASVEKDAGEFVIAQLAARMPQAAREMWISSPYFIPGDDGVKQLRGIAARGVDVRVLTNSLAANDVGAVHTGYARYRPDLLRAGVKLFELQRVTAVQERVADRRQFGSAAASLHAKAVVIDRQSVFVGSLNFDPRSVRRNTEVGVVIDSVRIGERLARMMEALMSPVMSYSVTLRDGPDSKSNALVWRSKKGEQDVLVESEPETTWFKRFSTRMMGLVPFMESQL